MQEKNGSSVEFVGEFIGPALRTPHPMTNRTILPGRILARPTECSTHRPAALWRHRAENETHDHDGAGDSISVLLEAATSAKKTGNERR